MSLVTALLYWPATRYEWLLYWDDGHHLVWNEAYKGLSLSHLWWMLHPRLGQWMPLTWLSWAIDFKLWGLDPGAFHRTNVLLHAAAAGLLVLVAWRVIRAAAPAATSDALTIAATVTALLWALHPLRVESVAWVNERRDVLCGFFYLLAVLTYLLSVASRRTPEERSGIAPQTDRGPWTRGASVSGRGWLLLSILCFALAVLSKALAVTLPVALLLLDFYPLRRRAWAEKIPYLGIAAIGAGMAFYALKEMKVIAPLVWFSLEDRVLISAYSLWFYFAKTLWPSALSPMHELTFTPRLFEGGYVLALVGVGGATWLAIRGWRAGKPAWSVTWIAYAVAVLPICGAVQNGYQIAADRYSYLPSLPLVLLAGGGLAWGLHRVDAAWRPVMGAVAGLVVGALALTTAGYMPVFRTMPVFWARTVAIDPACVSCAEFIVHAGDLAISRTELAEIVRAHPDLQEQRWALGMVSFIRARGAEGEAQFREYLRQTAERNPDYIPRIETERQKHILMARQVLERSGKENLRTVDVVPAGVAGSR